MFALCNDICKAIYREKESQNKEAAIKISLQYLVTYIWLEKSSGLLLTNNEVISISPVMLASRTLDK
jgi:hypothetical protein